jgi:hypothetical protein
MACLLGGASNRDERLEVTTATREGEEETHGKALSFPPSAAPGAAIPSADDLHLLNGSPSYGLAFWKPRNG